MKDGGVKTILVIARSDPLEAMRVAAGITIFGHAVALVFAHGVLEITEQVEEMAELIDLAEIEPKSLHADPEIPQMSTAEFHRLLQQSDFTLNV